MKRAGIYARFSSDLQNARSIDDQVALCRDVAARERLQVVAAFDDRASSGSATQGRPGLARLLLAAEARQFDVLIVEALDRISRDLEDMAGIYKRLTFHGIDILTAHSGRADPIQVAVRAIVNSLYITDMAFKVRRGQAGNIRDGKSAGKMPYGYSRTPTPGIWTINEAEAAVIRRVFSEYVAGDRPRAIARGLNRDGIKPPRGAYWRPGSLTGSNNGRNAIIGNEIYCGIRIWNRVRMVKPPGSNKRLVRANPESEWKRGDVPHLAIVDRATFDAAQAIRAARAKLPAAYRQKPRHMLSGLLRCGGCGGGMTVKDRDNGRVRIMCTRRRDGYDCDNGRSYYLDGIESQVLDGFRKHLINPAAIKRFLATYHAERKRLSSGGHNRRAEIDKEVAEIDRRLARAVEATLASTEPVAALATALDALQRRKGTLEAERAVMQPANVVSLHPTAVARYLARVDGLADALRNGTANEETMTAIRDLIESVVVIPAPAGQTPTIDVRSKLHALVEIALPGGQVESPAGYVLTPRLPIFQFRCA